MDANNNAKKDPSKNNSIIKPENKGKILCMLCLLIAVLAEVYIGNFRHWESYFFPEVSYREIALGEGITYLGGNTYAVDPSQDAGIYILDINDKVDNLLVDLDFEYNYVDKANLSVEVCDEGHSLLSQAFYRPYYPDAPQTKCYRTHFYGNASLVRINLAYLNCEQVNINEIGVNTKAPFHFSLVRFLLILGAMGFGLALYKVPQWISFDFTRMEKKKRYFFLGAAILFVQLAIWYAIASHNCYFTDYNYRTNQYPRLTEALANGRFYIDEPVSEALKNLSNPYDRYLRDSVESDYLWDYAYFEGKYYVYFGIVPALLFYLPYYLIFGTHIMNYQVAILCLGLMLAGFYLLLWKLMNRQQSKIPVPLFYGLALLMVNVIGAGVAYSPDHYTVPILTAMALIVWGAFSIWKAYEASGKSKYVFYFLGALCWALTAGCRPQFLIFSFFLLPIYYAEWKKNKNSLGKFILITLFLAIPYCMAAAGQMYYNYARFGSVFDFGANYNLTTNDMTHRVWTLDSIFDGLFYYLFCTISLHSSFPYLRPVMNEYATNGVIIFENTFGGILALCPLFALLALPLCKKDFYTDKLHGKIHVASLLMGLLVLIADTEMAGLLYRYQLDFDFFLMLPLFLVLLQLYKSFAKMDSKISVYATRFLMLLMAGSLVLYFLIPFVAGNTLDSKFLGYAYYALHIR